MDSQPLALASIGKPAVPTLVSDLPDTIALLGSMGPQAKDAIDDLAPFLDKTHEDTIRFSAAEALAAIGGGTDEILPVVCEMYRSESPKVRVQAVKVMRTSR